MQTFSWFDVEVAHLHSVEIGLSKMTLDRGGGGGGGDEMVVYSRTAVCYAQMSEESHGHAP